MPIRTVEEFIRAAERNAELRAYLDRKDSVLSSRFLDTMGRVLERYGLPEVQAILKDRKESEQNYADRIRIGGQEKQVASSDIYDKFYEFVVGANGLDKPVSLKGFLIRKLDAIALQTLKEEEA